MEPHRPAPSARKPDNTRWTGEKATAFLRLLARGVKVAPAARAVGMSRQAAYRLRERAPGFARYWALALEEAEKLREAERRGRRPGRGQGRGQGRERKPVHPLLSRAPIADGGTPDALRRSRADYIRALAERHLTPDKATAGGAGE